MRRRVGSESALNTRFIILLLANDRSLSTRPGAAQVRREVWRRLDKLATVCVNALDEIHRGDWLGSATNALLRRSSTATSNASDRWNGRGQRHVRGVAAVSFRLEAPGRY